MRESPNHALRLHQEPKPHTGTKEHLQDGVTSQMQKLTAPEVTVDIPGQHPPPHKVTKPLTENREIGQLDNALLRTWLKLIWPCQTCT